MKRSESNTSEVEGQTWICQACTFQNHPSVKECQICSSEKSNAKETQKIEQQIGSGFSCHACKHKLQKLVSKCPNCNQTLIPSSDSDNQEDKTKKQTKKQDKFIKCPSCEQQNDKNNEVCVFCQEQLQQKQQQLIPIKKRAYRKPKPRYRGGVMVAACKYCGMHLYPGLEAHEQSCYKMSGQQLQTKYLLVQKNYCPFCYQKVKFSQFESHQKQCSSRKQFYNQDCASYKRCSKLQKQTILYMHKKSQKLHWIAQKALIKRITALGFKASDLQNLHHYIVNYAPIIIHMHVNSHMQFFVKDTHYRNQFETKKSSGSLSSSSRISWQDRMFDRKHHSATPFERVKYGTINFTNDPKGVRACVGYGQSYFLLKPHVRNRCTVTDMDSSSPTATIATFQFCYHLLNKLPDAELKAAFEGSKASQVESMVIGTYKQIQIHGPVQFKEDIERVYVNKAELTDPSYLNMVKQFCKNNDLEYEVFGVQPPKPVHAAIGGGGFGFGGFGTGLFGYSAPATSLFPSPVFSAPVPSMSTAHLFGAARSRIVAPPRPVQKQKQLQQGVDYI